MQTFCHLAIPSHRELTKLTIEMQRVFRDIFGNIRLEDGNVHLLFFIMEKNLKPLFRYASYVMRVRLAEANQTKEFSRCRLLLDPLESNQQVIYAVLRGTPFE